MRAEGFRRVLQEGKDRALENALPARAQTAQRIGAQLPRPPGGRLQVEERGFGGRGFQRAHRGKPEGSAALASGELSLQKARLLFALTSAYLLLYPWQPQSPHPLWRSSNSG